MRRAFLTARWENLILLNFAAPPELLRPLVPRGTELDYWQGATLVSLVAFGFAGTRVMGVPVPGHRDFEEVNLRFYVRRRTGEGGARRAVVFIREIVPRRAIATIARWLYNEPYLTAPMHHDGAFDERGGSVTYGWSHGGAEFRVRGVVRGPAGALVPGSEAEFITEHFWGYTRQRDGGTLEYEVEHPRWRVWTQPEVTFEGPAGQLYGGGFGHILAGPRRSAYVALGSAVRVFRGRRLDGP